MKTAVEWYIDSIKDLEHKKLKDKISLEVYITTKTYLKEKAKEMENQQKKDLVIFFYIDLKMKNNKLPYGMQYLNKLTKLEEEAEKYYNKTFKQSNFPEFPTGSKQ